MLDKVKFIETTFDKLANLPLDPGQFIYVSDESIENLYLDIEDKRICIGGRSIVESIMQSDWAEENENSFSYIKNKPNISSDLITGVTGVKGDSETVYRDGNVNITKDNIGLGNVDNTADLDKRVEYANKAYSDTIGNPITTTYLRKDGFFNFNSSNNNNYTLGMVNKFNDFSFTKSYNLDEIKEKKYARMIITNITTNEVVASRIIPIDTFNNPGILTMSLKNKLQYIIPTMYEQLAITELSFNVEINFQTHEVISSLTEQQYSDSISHIDDYMGSFFAV